MRKMMIIQLVIKEIAKLNCIGKKKSITKVVNGKKREEEIDK